MDSLKLKITGISPILLHNTEMANPLSVYAKALKPLTSKRNKTERDHLELSKMEWQAGLYMHNGQVCIPGDNIFRALWDGSKKNKNGKKVQAGCLVDEDMIPLSYGGKFINVKDTGEFPNEELEKYYPYHHFTKLVKVSSSKTPRTRPIFHDWHCTFTVIFDDDIIDGFSILEAMEAAGKMIGMGDWRPRFGRFTVEKAD